MIIGDVKNKKTVRFEIELHCSSCKKRVPGGMRASEEFVNSSEFEEKISGFKSGYLCGVCRDRKRTR